MQCYMWQVNTTIFYIPQWDQSDERDQLSSLLIFSTIGSQEFFLIPEENYVEEEPNSSEVLIDPTITEKVEQLTLLQRKKTCGRKRWKLDCTPSGRKSAEYCREKDLRIIIVVETRIDRENNANLEKKVRSLGCSC